MKEKHATCSIIDLIQNTKLKYFNYVYLHAVPNLLPVLFQGHNTGRHRSKGSLEKENRGRVGVKVVSKKGSKIQRKVDRRHQQLQARQKETNSPQIQNKKGLVQTFSTCSCCVFISYLLSGRKSWPLYQARELVQKQKRGLGTAASPPLLVALIPLEEGQVHNLQSLLNTIHTCIPDLQVSLSCPYEFFSFEI